MATATWEHPDLGRFEFNGYGWAKAIEVPAFAAFTYDTGDAADACELEFEADDEADVPSAEAVSLVSRVLANQDELAAAVAAALWDDFNGRGPPSGMWWHGALDEVSDGMEDSGLPPLDGPAALRAWMRLSSVTFRKGGPRNAEPVVELSFVAAFEEEHGVGVLTDGERILGTGYSYDVRPFSSNSAKRDPVWVSISRDGNSSPDTLVIDRRAVPALRPAPATGSTGGPAMSRQLTWDDLLIQDVTPEQFRDWLAPWGAVVSGRVALAFLNKFGSWFLRRPEGHVEVLDVFTGRLERVADSYDQFIREVNEQWWQEVYLLSELVYQFHQAGKVPGPGQCYALAPHPALGGPNPVNGDAIDPRFVTVTDIAVWQSICAQSVSRGAAGKH